MAILLCLQEGRWKIGKLAAECHSDELVALFFWAKQV